MKEDRGENKHTYHPLLPDTIIGLATVWINDYWFISCLCQTSHIT